MTGSLGDNKTNLTGIWHGQFTYSASLEPVFFVATLQESEGWIDGTTHEPRPGTGETLYAVIGGRRFGSAVTFVKTYQNPPRGYGVVRYAGALNADATEIEGSWQIPGDGSGRFLMIRGNGTEESVVREVSEFV